ncbi:uncharacterized protein LOC118204850 [Stegodyphus dumicola]|uniref:uncharacterized protein LOC118204850 n=1 Tax=Stegodyphus dumicola TaxID=202533 RepID=UPI0015B0BD3E|nr:uncharacterized protein LOC118204850 [Stegodyphus dumicola]
MHLLHTTSLYTSLSLLLLEPLPVSRAFKIILMYAPCDSYLTNLLHLVHRAIREHYEFHEDTQMREKPRHLIHHARHDLSNACMWVLQRTVAVIAVSNATKIWKGIDVTAHHYNLPHLVTPQFCNCSRKFPKSQRHSRLLDFPVIRLTFTNF